MLQLEFFLWSLKTGISLMVFFCFSFLQVLLYLYQNDCSLVQKTLKSQIHTGIMTPTNHLRDFKNIIRPYNEGPENSFPLRFSASRPRP